jgi:hypothetical protein
MTIAICTANSGDDRWGISTVSRPIPHALLLLLLLRHTDAKACRSAVKNQQPRSWGGGG